MGLHIFRIWGMKIFWQVGIFLSMKNIGRFAVQMRVKYVFYVQFNKCVNSF